MTDTYLIAYVGGIQLRATPFPADHTTQITNVDLIGALILAHSLVQS